MRNLIALLVMSLFFAGCAIKTKVMDASVVSMTHGPIVDGQKLQEKGPVSGKFCSSTFGDKGSIGLFDEAVKAAQKENGVDYITEATFWNDGGCITVEGTGKKLVAANGVPMAAPVAPSATPKAPIAPKKTK